MINGRKQIRSGALTKVDNMKLISATSKIALTGSAAHERRRSEVIQTVKILDELTAALRR